VNIIQAYVLTDSALQNIFLLDIWSTVNFDVALFCNWVKNCVLLLLECDCFFFVNLAGLFFFLVIHPKPITRQRPRAIGIIVVAVSLLKAERQIPI